VEALATEFTNLGGKIYFNSEVTAINYGLLGLGKSVTLANGASFLTSTVLLNLPPHEIKKINGLTPYSTPPSPTAALAFALPFNVHSAKFYVYYEEAWWREHINITSATPSTTEFVRAIYYDDSTTKYNPTTKKYSGWIGGEAYGDDISGYFRAASRNQSAVFTTLLNDELGGQLLYNIHTSLLRMHSAILNVPLNTIPAPTKGLLANWNVNTIGGFHSLQPSPLDPSVILQQFQAATAGSIYVVNEAFSPRNGWAEGSLVMAEKFLRINFNLGRPSWLDEAYYNYAVVQDL